MSDLLELLPAGIALATVVAVVVGVKVSAKGTKDQLAAHEQSDRETHGIIYGKVQALHVEVTDRLGRIETQVAEINRKLP